MLEIGRFVITGDWDNTPVPSDKLHILIPPLGHVFGAGWHPATQAVLEILPEYVHKGTKFADVGTGSGILCVAAKLLEASECYATELDPDALSAAKKVFAVNNVKVTLIEGTFFEADVDVAVVSISSDFVHQNHSLVKAKTIIAVHDDFTIEVGPPFMKGKKDEASPTLDPR